MANSQSWIFFDALVDINANKLVLSVSTYKQNDWILCCARIHSQLKDVFIFLLMDLLGIDGSELGWNTFIL